MNETRVKDIDWKAYEKKAAKLEKKQLIQFLSKKTERSKRDLEKKIEIESREKNVIDSYVAMLSSILPTYEDDVDTKRGKIKKKYFEDTQSKLKQIKVHEEEIKKKEKEIDAVKKPKNECYGKKKEAQNRITKKLVQQVYKFFEKNSSEVPVKLMETFVGCLRGSEKGTRDDLEIYLRAYKGLVCSMNKLEEIKIPRDHAKTYADGLKELVNPIQDKEYIKLMPFYVWMDNVVRIIRYVIEEKHLRQDVQQKEDAIFKIKHDIDRNQIILDHLGIDPNEYNHMSNIVDFWRRHLVDLQKHYEEDVKDLDHWESNHTGDMHLHVKNHKDEKTTAADMKIDYPVFGETPQEPSKSGNKGKFEDSKEAENAENESDDEGSSEEYSDDADQVDDDEGSDDLINESHVSVKV